jgi:hypothetical protein
MGDPHKLYEHVRRRRGVSRQRVCSAIETAAEQYRKEKGTDPQVLVLTQDEYIQLSAEVGRMVHSYRRMRILVRWGIASNKAITI